MLLTTPNPSCATTLRPHRGDQAVDSQDSGHDLGVAICVAGVVGIMRPHKNTMVNMGKNSMDYMGIIWDYIWHRDYMGIIWALYVPDQ